QSISRFQKPSPEDGGLYQCAVQNDNGEVNANLALNVETFAPEVLEQPKMKVKKTKTKTKKKSVIIEAAVAADENTELKWVKGNETVASTESKTEDVKFTVTRKQSETNPNEAVVQLEIEGAAPADMGDYQLVATNEKGETTKSKKISVSEQSIALAPAAKVETAESEAADALVSSEATEVKKKKKKVVKKKKKKEEEDDDTVKPEIVSFLKNLVCISLRKT
ncbi:hypothetical protein TCAL_13185, partial [Tigriopus californicus]